MQEEFIQPISFSSFRGLNTKLSKISLAQREAADLQNVILTQERIDCRLGDVLHSTTQLIEGGAAKAVTGIVQAVLGTTVVRVVTGGTKVYSMTAGGVLSDITGAFTITDSANNLYSFATIKDGSNNDILVGGNGVNGNWKWTGTGNIAALGGSPPGNFKHLLLHKNRLWGSVGEFVYHSGLLNGESWDALNWVLKFKSRGISTNDITFLGTLGDTIVISKEDMFFLFSGESALNGYVQSIATGEGFASGYSVREVISRRYGNILIGVNRRGELIGFNGTKDLIRISDPIDNLLDTYNSARAPYTSGVVLKNYNHYIVTHTSGSGSAHDRLIAYDYFLDGVDPAPDGKFESTLLLHKGLALNCMAIMDHSNKEEPFGGTVDGWVVRLDTGNRDVVKASQITGSGASRTSNVVTITTSAPHGFAVGDEVIVSGVTDSSFNGTFTVATAPTSTTFTYAQTASNASSGNGIARKEAKIDAYWESKKEAFGNAVLQKQLNDLHITTAGSAGQIRVTVTTDKNTGQKDQQINSSGTLYGTGSIYGQVKYGGGGTSFTQVELATQSGVECLTGRYFQFKFRNVDGYLMSIEEYIPGITGLGYQPEVQVA